MKRTVLFTLIISLASAPLAWADGPIVSSAKRQAQELVRTDATPSLEANSSSAAVVQDSGMSGKSKMLMAVAIGVVAALGMKIIATSGTARALQNNGIPVETVLKIHEGRPHVLDLIKNQ